MYKIEGNWVKQLSKALITAFDIILIFYFAIPTKVLQAKVWDFYGYGIFKEKIK